MELKERKSTNRNKKTKTTIFLYCAALVVAIIGIALLVNNIVLVKKTVSQYVAQGYSASTVMQSMLYSTLLPDIFNSIGIYGGIAAGLFGIAKVNDTVSLSAVCVNEVSETKASPVKTSSTEAISEASAEKDSETKETEENKQNN